LVPCSVQVAADRET